MKPKSPRKKTPPTDKKWIRTKADRLAVKQGCYFDRAAADFAVDFIETFCTLTKGRTAGRKVRLLDWQTRFGLPALRWKRKDGTRRFRTAYIEIPKKNGKSLLMSAIAIYMAIADGESGAEVYLAAVNSKQARIIFDECKKMILSSPALKKRLEIKDTNKKIIYRPSFSRSNWSPSMPNRRTASTPPAPSSTSCIGRRIPSSGMCSSSREGAENSPSSSPSHRRNDKTSVCWQEHQRARKIIDGTSLDTTHLAVIFAADRSDNLDDPKTWKKANPSLGYTLSVEDFANDLAKVRESPSRLNNFLRLRLDIWTEPETSYISHEHWERCGKEPINWKSLIGKRCFAGLDLSSKKDITALVLLFGDETEGFTLVPRFWIPETQAREREREDAIPYSSWASQGLITLTPDLRSITT